MAGWLLGVRHTNWPLRPRTARIGAVTPEPKSTWPREADEWLRGEIHRLFTVVVAAGGAIGFVDAPRREETDAWIDQTLARVRAGDGAWLVVVDGQAVVANGMWRRGPGVVFSRLGEVHKIMADPAVRGRGLGGFVTKQLIDSARDAGIETIELGVRGNNHRAIQIYEELGFVEWGRRPNSIEVGDERYDDVRMSQVLQRGDTVVLRGSDPSGNGGSPRR